MPEKVKRPCVWKEQRVFVHITLNKEKDKELVEALTKASEKSGNLSYAIRRVLKNHLDEL